MAEKKFPPSITKEYIYGCSLYERNETFTLLLNELRTQIKIIEEEKTILKYQHNSQLLNHKDAMIEEKFNLIKVLKESMNTEWVRPPLYTKRAVDVMRIKRNEKIDPQMLVANIQILNFNDPNMYYFLKLTGVKGETQKMFPVQNTKTQTYHWTFDELQFRELFKQELTIHFYKKQ